MKIEIELEVSNPALWQPTGEYRKAVDMEPYFSGGYVHRGPTTCDVVIAKKVEPARVSRWSPATLCFGYGSAETARSAHRNAPLVRIDYENARPVTASIEEA